MNAPAQERPPQGGSDIVLRGSLPGVAGIVRCSEPVPIPVTVRFDSPLRVASCGRLIEDSSPITAYLAPMGVDLARLQVYLPLRTAPGTYPGVAQIREREHRIAVEVAPIARLSILPARLSLASASPGKILEDLTLVNEGNVPLEVPKVGGFGIFEDDGIERSFQHAYVAELKPGERRVDRLLEEFRSRHGGIVRMELGGGGRELAAGDTCELGVTLRIPRGLPPGRTFGGTWAIHNVNYAIDIKIAGKASEEDATYESS